MTKAAISRSHHSRICPVNNLLLTSTGEDWLSNFDNIDKPIARDLASNLTLISETEFERELIKLIESQITKQEGCIALFGVRELLTEEKIFNADDSEVNATPRGADIGSEGRIATIIRNFQRTSKERVLNHPSILEMRSHRVRHIFFIDDFIGSGKRVTSYIARFYDHASIKSWFSYKKISAKVIAYSGTDRGISRVTNSARMKPSVRIVRSCPTIDSIGWDDLQIAKVKELCKRYAKKHAMGYPLGFGKIGALLVFEHSCPNNCPMILWGTPEKEKFWKTLFLGKSVATESRKVFPAEIVRHDSVSMLIAAGEKRIANAAKNIVRRPLPAEWVATLSLFGRGIRRIDALEGVTGMNHAEASDLIEKCVASGLLTQKWRLSDFGRQELRATQKITSKAQKNLSKVEPEDYYPLALRDRN